MNAKFISLFIGLLFSSIEAAEDPSKWWRVSEDGRSVIYNGPPPPPQPSIGKMVESIVPDSANFDTGTISLNIVNVLISGNTRLQYAPKVEIANLRTFWHGVAEEKVLNVTRGQRFQDPPLVQPSGAHRGMLNMASLIPTYTYQCHVTRVQETPCKAHILWHGNVVKSNGSSFELSYHQQIDRSYTASVKERELALYFDNNDNWLKNKVPQ